MGEIEIKIKSIEIEQQAIEGPAGSVYSWQQDNNKMIYWKVKCIG